MAARWRRRGSWPSRTGWRSFRATACARSRTAAGRGASAPRSRKLFPEEYARWEADPFSVRAVREARRPRRHGARAAGSPRGSSRRTRTSHVLIVSHKATIRLLDAASSSASTRAPTATASTRARRRSTSSTSATRPTRRLSLFNDTSHYAPSCSVDPEMPTRPPSRNGGPTPCRSCIHYDDLRSARRRNRFRSVYDVDTDTITATNLPAREEQEGGGQRHAGQDEQGRDEGGAARAGGRPSRCRGRSSDARPAARARDEPAHRGGSWRRRERRGATGVLVDVREERDRLSPACSCRPSSRR